MAIRKLLVANRGEIAVRIIRAAQELGITTVAGVQRRRSRHAGRAPRRRRVISRAGACREVLSEHRDHAAGRADSGADAVHPGYGFLVRECRISPKRSRRPA